MSLPEGSDQSRLPLAGIVFKSKDPVNSLLEDVSRTLTVRGLNLAGVLQQSVIPEGRTEKNVCLSSLRNDWQTPVLQDRGAHAQGCRLDPHAITDVAGRLSVDLEAGADMLIVNRFGRAESEGYGLRQVLEQAVCGDIPVLLAVREDYVSAWEEFHGGMGELLPMDRDVVLAWCDSVCSRETSPA
ncbi:DUF2478 domain-containing protein [uncultured Roseibium sp.]|uniref:DUF2478 domain-containing protein n=1 Tax=uncultured Roseibium sp. TaxID=1936171 RepID=UPI0032162111